MSLAEHIQLLVWLLVSGLSLNCSAITLVRKIPVQVPIMMDPDSGREKSSQRKLIAF